MRNGRDQYQDRQAYCSTGGSGLLSSLMSLAGGVGLGAGLLYLLDPDKGADRRENLVSGARHLGSDLSEKARGFYSSAADAVGGAKDYAGEKYESARDYTGSALGSVASLFGSARKYAGSKYDDARDYAAEKICGETRAQHRLGVTVCALGSMALGAALMYIFDPATGRARRQLAADKARQYTNQASGALRSGYETARESVSSAASAVGSKVSDAASAVGNKVGLTGKSESSMGAACPPGMVAVPVTTTTTGGSSAPRM